MPFWKTKPVDQEPELYLDPWWVFAVSSPDGTGKDHHLNGFVIPGLYGKVSTKIVSFDPEKRVVTTSTGRKYFLTGRQGCNNDALYVLWKWLEIAELTEAEIEDVTHLYLPKKDSNAAR